MKSPAAPSRSVPRRPRPIFVDRFQQLRANILPFRWLVAVGGDCHCHHPRVELLALDHLRQAAINTHGASLVSTTVPSSAHTCNRRVVQTRPGQALLAPCAAGPTETIAVSNPKRKQVLYR